MGDTKRCPYCSEEIQAAAVKCRHCGEMLSGDAGAIAAGRMQGADELTTGEWWAFGIAFFFIPCVNVLVSSILYYVWRGTRPRRADQINRLGWLVFLGQILLRFALGFLLANMR